MPPATRTSAAAGPSAPAGGSSDPGTGSPFRTPARASGAAPAASPSARTPAAALGPATSTGSVSTSTTTDDSTILVGVRVVLAAEQFEDKNVELLEGLVKSMGGDVITELADATLLVIHPGYDKPSTELAALESYPPGTGPVPVPYHYLSCCLDAHRRLDPPSDPLALGPPTFDATSSTSSLPQLIFYHRSRLASLQPLRAWVSVNVARDMLAEKSAEAAHAVVTSQLATHGALIVKKRADADLLVVDLKSQFSKTVLKEKREGGRTWQKVAERPWVEGCVASGKMAWVGQMEQSEDRVEMAGKERLKVKEDDQDSFGEEDFVPDTKGPGRPTGKPRIEYSPSDDDFLCRYLAAFHPDGSWASRKTYNMMVQASTQYPIVDRHSSQSWHERFKKNSAAFARRVNRFAEEGIDETLKTEMERAKAREKEAERKRARQEAAGAQMQGEAAGQEIGPSGSSSAPAAAGPSRPTTLQKEKHPSLQLDMVLEPRSVGAEESTMATRSTTVKGKRSLVVDSDDEEAAPNAQATMSIKEAAQVLPVTVEEVAAAGTIEAVAATAREGVETNGAGKETGAGSASGAQGALEAEEEPAKGQPGESTGEEVQAVTKSTTTETIATEAVPAEVTTTGTKRTTRAAAAAASSGKARKMAQELDPDDAVLDKIYRADMAKRKRAAEQKAAEEGAEQAQQAQGVPTVEVAVVSTTNEVESRVETGQAGAEGGQDESQNQVEENLSTAQDRPTETGTETQILLADFHRVREVIANARASPAFPPLDSVLPTRISTPTLPTVGAGASPGPSESGMPPEPPILPLAPPLPPQAATSTLPRSPLVVAPALPADPAAAVVEVNKSSSSQGKRPRASDPVSLPGDPRSPPRADVRTLRPAGVGSPQLNRSPRVLGQHLPTQAGHQSPRLQHPAATTSATASPSAAAIQLSPPTAGTQRMSIPLRLEFDLRTVAAPNPAPAGISLDAIAPQHPNRSISIDQSQTPGPSRPDPMGHVHKRARMSEPVPSTMRTPGAGSASVARKRVSAFGLGVHTPSPRSTPKGMLEEIKSSATKRRISLQRTTPGPRGTPSSGGGSGKKAFTPDTVYASTSLPPRRPIVAPTTSPAPAVPVTHPPPAPPLSRAEYAAAVDKGRAAAQAAREGYKAKIEAYTKVYGLTPSEVVKEIATVPRVGGRVYWENVDREFVKRFGR